MFFHVLLFISICDLCTGSPPRVGGEEETRRPQRESNCGRPTCSQCGGRGACLYSEPAVRELAVVGGRGGQLSHLYKGHPSGDPRTAAATSTHSRGVGLTFNRLLLLPWKPLYSWPSAACCSTWGISPRSVSLFCSSFNNVSQLRRFV
jgi:hypothetical protein